MIIAGFLTDGPAIKQQDKLRIGDWIRSIDGHQVRPQSKLCSFYLLDITGHAGQHRLSAGQVQLLVQGEAHGAEGGHAADPGESMTDAQILIIVS